jgi:L-amino acid N-acyltransferase YncA
MRLRNEGNMIRQAIIQDAAEIARIHVSAWQAAYRGIVPQTYLDSLDIDARRKRWVQNLENASNNIYVAEDVSGMTGWIIFGPSRDEDIAEGHEINAIYVQPKSWGMGIGKQLIYAAETILLKAYQADITVWVFEDNFSSRSFYTKVGYTQDGAKKVEDFASTQLTEIRFRKYVDKAAAQSVE